MYIKTIIAIAVISLTSYAASAQVADNAAQSSTIKNNRGRIKQGVKSGELTKAEAKRLAVQNKALKHERKEIREDGDVTKAERVDYRKDKKKVSRRIYRQKNDRQSRP